METINYIFDVIPSPDDPRDWKISDIIAKAPAVRGLPPVVDYRSVAAPIRNQGSLGSCAAFTAAGIKEIQESKDALISPDGSGKVQNYFSPGFVYYHRNNSSEGMYGRNVMNILLNHGCPIEKDYPYSGRDDKMLGKEMTTEVLVKAKNFRIKGYARVNSINEAKEALYRFGPLYMAFPCYNTGKRFWRKDGSSLGGHAVCCYGYTSEGFVIRNSWGSNWADDGYTIYPYSDWGAHWEIFSLVDAESVPVDEKPDDFVDDKDNGNCSCANVTDSCNVQ